MIHGYVTLQMRRDKSEYVRRENARVEKNLLNGRRPAFGRIDLRCLLRSARRYEGLISEYENDGDRAEVVEKISVQDKCNENR